MFTCEMNFHLLSLDGTQSIFFTNSLSILREFKASRWSSLWINVDGGGSGRLMQSVAEVTAYPGCSQSIIYNDLRCLESSAF